MSQHFRTAVLTVILAGGTLVSYAAAYETMPKSATTAPAAIQSVRTSGAMAQRAGQGQTDVSVREACASFEGIGDRTRCVQEISGVARPVRVIDFVESQSPATRG